MCGFILFLFLSDPGSHLAQSTLGLSMQQWKTLNSEPLASGLCGPDLEASITDHVFLNFFLTYLDKLFFLTECPSQPYKEEMQQEPPHLP